MSEQPTDQKVEADSVKQKVTQKRSKSTVNASNANTTPSVALFGCIIILLLAMFFYYFKLRNAVVHVQKVQKMKVPDNSKVNTKHKSEEEVAVRQYVVKSMYIPKEIGHRTTTERVFLTNKGLRVLPVNTDGLPLPAHKEDIKT